MPCTKCIQKQQDHQNSTSNMQSTDMKITSLKKAPSKKAMPKITSLKKSR